MSALTTAQLLRKAAVVLRERGWRQEGYGHEDGPVCVLGACNVAAGMDAWGGRGSKVEIRVSPWLAKATDHHNFFDWPDIAVWNDRPHRTVDEVLAALDAAAAIAEAEEATS